MICHVYIANDGLVDWYFNGDFTHSNMDFTYKNDSTIGFALR